MRPNYDLMNQVEYKRSIEFKPTFTAVTLVDEKSENEFEIPKFEFEWRESAGDIQVNCSKPKLPGWFKTNDEYLLDDLKHFIGQELGVKSSDVKIYFVNQ